MRTLVLFLLLLLAAVTLLRAAAGPTSEARHPGETLARSESSPL